MPPTPHESDRGDDDWMPFKDQVQFEVADFLFCCNQMSAGDINFITGLWAASLAAHDDYPPFQNAKDMYDTIDAGAAWDLPDGCEWAMSPKHILQGAGKEQYCKYCGYVQHPISIYGMRWLQVPAMPHVAPFLKVMPSSCSTSTCL